MGLPHERATWDFHRSWIGSIFSRRWRASPGGSGAVTAFPLPGGGLRGAAPSASLRDGSWRTDPAENAISPSRLAWPLRHSLIWRAFRCCHCPGYVPRRESRRVRRAVPNKYGLARVGFGERGESPPFVRRTVCAIWLTEGRATTAHAVGKLEARRPPAYRCRHGVDSPYLPA